MNRHRQIITLQVDFDLTKVAPPEKWDWNLTAELGTDIKVLASSAIETRPVHLPGHAVDELTKRVGALCEVLDDLDTSEAEEQQIAAALQSIRDFAFDESFAEALTHPEQQPHGG